MEDMDMKMWNTIYPHYLNSKLTYKEGRRVHKDSCVPNPQAQEMAQVCEALKIPHTLEMNKAYPRDWMVRGRVKVMLKTPAGKFTHPEIHTKMDLLKKMGELIPTSKQRKEHPEGPPHPRDVIP